VSVSIEIQRQKDTHMHISITHFIHPRTHVCVCVCVYIPAMAGVGGAHHVLGLEGLVGELRDRHGTVLLGAAGGLL
jgi:hypothetical protein